MGALHAGHRSLVERAAAECDVVAVTVFVNPLQFNDAVDLAHYPRDLDGDVASGRGGRRHDRVRPVGARDVPGVPRPRGHVGARGRGERCPRGRVAPGPLRRGGHRRGQALLPGRPRAGPTSARRTSSSWPWSGAWRPTCRSRSRSSGARRCARPTAWPCRAATSGCRPSARSAALALRRALDAGLAVLGSGRARPCRWSKRPWAPPWAGTRWCEPDYAVAVDAATLAPTPDGEKLRGEVRLLVAAVVDGVRSDRQRRHHTGSRRIRRFVAAPLAACAWSEPSTTREER